MKWKQFLNFLMELRLRFKSMNRPSGDTVDDSWLRDYYRIGESH